MLLVDTSVWIEVFRKRDPLHLEHTAPLDEVATCLPVIQEVLQGFRDDRAFELAREESEALKAAIAKARGHFGEEGRLRQYLPLRHLSAHF